MDVATTATAAATALQRIDADADGSTENCCADCRRLVIVPALGLFVFDLDAGAIFLASLRDIADIS